MGSEIKFRVVMLKAMAMVLWWVGWRMDKLDSTQFNETLKELDELRAELEAQA